VARPTASHPRRCHSSPSCTNATNPFSASTCPLSNTLPGIPAATAGANKRGPIAGLVESRFCPWGTKLATPLERGWKSSNFPHRPHLFLWGSPRKRLVGVGVHNLQIVNHRGGCAGG